jgi:acyl-CoA thioesterase-1
MKIFLKDKKMRSACSFFAGVLLFVTVGCDAGGGEGGTISRNATEFAIAQTEAKEDLPLIVALGDSLTAGFGLSLAEGYPARLQERLDEAGYRMRIVNAGVSGDTTAGGLRRLDWALIGDVRILILALGGNDGLRGLPVKQMKDNLSKIIVSALDQGVLVLLTGMEAPPNFGSSYTENFRRVFLELDADYDVSFVPFLLEGIAARLELNQSDGIHPNAAGAELIAEQLWTYLEPMIVVVVKEFD